MSTTNSSTANAYARSMLELANEQGQQAEAIGKELAEIRDIIRANRGFSDFLSNPGIGATERTEALERVFRGKVSPLVWNFIGVLNAHGRIGQLAQIADAYEDLLEEQMGIVEVDVIVAQRLDPSQLEQVRERVSQALGKTAVVHQYVDESIIGGIVLRVQDKLIDASVKHQLKALRGRMLASRRK